MQILDNTDPDLYSPHLAKGRLCALCNTHINLSFLFETWSLSWCSSPVFFFCPSMTEGRYFASTFLAPPPNTGDHSLLEAEGSQIQGMPARLKWQPAKINHFYRTEGQWRCACLAAIGPGLSPVVREGQGGAGSASTSEIFFYIHCFVRHRDIFTLLHCLMSVSSVFTKSHWLHPSLPGAQDELPLQ